MWPQQSEMWSNPSGAALAQGKAVATLINMNDLIHKQKIVAAATAVDEIQSGMVVGLGSGSTAALMVDELGRRLSSGQLHDIIAVPTSEKTAFQAQRLGIPLTTLSEQPQVDLTIDGADEIDPQLDLIKGLGGSLLREKIVAASSTKLLIIADQRKLVQRLGSRSPLPVEVIPFAEQPVKSFLRSLGATTVLRETDGEIFICDEGNITLDCYFDPMPDPSTLAMQIIAQPGVVDHGFFLGMAHKAIVATETGIKIMTRGQ
jgi:ribose 5-phosphate isomerase A